MERVLDHKREEAIIRLLDDDSPVVQAALKEEFKRLDDAGIALLRKLARSRNRIVAAQARDFLEELQGPNTIKRFRAFIRSLNYELETGCLLLNRTVYPEVDVAETCMEIDAIAARCRELMVLPSSPWEKCKILNRVLFHEYGFRGNTENFDDPLNSFMAQVLERRKGIPITLSILYILVAQRCGLDLEPIGMPGRFMVGCFLEERPFYIDAYERGGVRTAEELKEILRRNNLKARPSFLAPSSVGDVLKRCCQNLVRQYSMKNNPSKAKLFASFVREFEVTYSKHANP